MLRDVKESPFPNTTVDCLRGAHISDVEQALMEDPHLSTYTNIVVHAGTNDIADENPNIIQVLERLITATQIKAPQAKIFVSSICPRRDRYDSRGFRDSRDNRFCHYCKRHGHSIDFCFIRNSNNSRSSRPYQG